MVLYVKVNRELITHVEEEYAIPDDVALPEDWEDMDLDEKFDWVQENHEDREDLSEEVQSTAEVFDVEVVKS